MPFDGLIASTKWGAPRVSKAAIEKYGLIAVVACNEMTGGITRDLISGAVLTAANGADWGASGAVVGARTNAADANYSATLTSPSKPTAWPASLFWRGSMLGALSGYEVVAGIAYGTGNSDPYGVLQFARRGDTGKACFFCNSGGGAGSYIWISDTADWPSSGVVDFAGVCLPGTAGMSIYRDGALAASGFTFGSTAGTGPSVTGTDKIFLGYVPAVGANAKAVHDILLIGAQGWTAEQVASLHADPYQVFEDPLADLRSVYGVAPPPPPPPPIRRMLLGVGV